MKKILIFIFSTLIITGCTDKFEGYNTDTKNPPEVPSGTLLTNSVVNLFNFTTSPSVNLNNFRLWSQQWAQTTYSDESNYELVERNVNGNTWDRLYTGVIKDAKEAKIVVAENPDPLVTNEQKVASDAVLEVIEIFAFHLLVDIFGDIPYSQALDIEMVTPIYDNDVDIYTDLISRLDVAISNLNNTMTPSMQGGDVVYAGDVSKWRKFANSLKLRLAIRVADTNGATAKTMVEQAVADGVFSSSDDDFELGYKSATPNTNPLWVSLVQSGRSDFVSANTLVDVMNNLNDPRRGHFFSQNIEKTDTILEMDTVSMKIDTIFNTYPIYVGGSYGDNNSTSSSSTPGSNQVNPEFPGTIMDFTEVNFLLADAAERGYSAGGSAEDFYKAGIESSILEWGGENADVEAYLANEKVAYSTAEGDWKQKIAVQKWLGLYNRGFEAWTTYRLYDYPEMNVAIGAETTPPMRYTYPVTEFSLNGANVEKAAENIGGDDLFTKIFWDVN